MRRRLVGLGLLAVLVAMAGCTSVFGPGGPDESALLENASYDWSTEANASITLNSSSYAAVYEASGANGTFEIYERGPLQREHNVDISRLRYRYPNGTTVTINSSALAVEQNRRRTLVSVPNASGGQLAYTAERDGKSFSTPVLVEGTHVVRLPPDARVGVPLLSQVRPGNYSTTRAGDRTVVRWEDSVPGRFIQIRYYLERDLLLFGGLFAVGLVLGIGGAVYYYLQIRRAAKRRSEAGIDVDEGDDPRDRGPPPGMR